MQDDVGRARAGISIIKEGERFTLPIEVPATVEGVHGKVPFKGKGTIRITGFASDESATRAGFPAWRMPGANIPDVFAFTDDRTGQLVQLVLGNDMLGWHRAHMAGRLTKRKGINIVWDVKGVSGWGFFEAGRNNWLVEFALNKIMGWNVLDEQDAWHLLTADTLSMGWPKEQVMNITVREHFFKSTINRLVLFKRARGRMEHDPSKPLAELVGGGAPEMFWIYRYVTAASTIERHTVRHPELANLYPEWTADALATQHVRMMQKINYMQDALCAHRENKVFIADVAGSLIGIGECIDRTEPFLVLSYEHAVEGLQAFRVDRIDSPAWLKYGGIEHVNKCIEWTELLLAGRLEEAEVAKEAMYRTFYAYLSDGAKDTGKNLPTLWLERQPIMLKWEVLQAYIRESVRRGVWNPIELVPLRIRAPPV